MRLGSLFSGIGGFEIGFERSGWTTEWQCEIEPHARKILSRHFPNTPCYKDITQVDFRTAPPVDCIAGGFPCQDISFATILYKERPTGLDGSRSSLFYEFARAIRESRPEWVVIENVPNLLFSNKGRDMGTVLGTLAELGYGYAYRVLDARYFGVAQQRRRVFIVGHSSGRMDGPRDVLFESEGGEWNPAPKPKTRQNREGVVYVEIGSGGSGISKTLTTQVRRDAQSETFVITGSGVRLMTPIERERLQGFPDNWTEGQADIHRIRQIGNAVCVPVAEWIGRRILMTGKIS